MPRADRPDKHRGPDVDTIARVIHNRAPTTSDFRRPETNRNYELNTIWLDTSTDDVWILVELANNLATWRRFDFIGSAAGIETITGDDGAVVTADTSGNVNILGTVVANAANTKPLWIDGDVSAFTLEAELQVSAAVTGAPADTNDAGICSFDDNYFSVTEHRHVSYIGGSGSFGLMGVDAATAPGTNPVAPTVGGLITVSGAAVVAHSNPIETHSRGINQFNVEAQLGTVVAPTPANSDDAGLLCANTNQFTVDATSGMLSLKGGNLPAVLTLTGDDGTVISPDASGDIDQHGLVLDAGILTQPFYVDGDAANNKLDFKLQVASAVHGAPKSKNDVGLCCFDDNSFDVDADGYVTLVAPPTGTTSINVDANTAPGVNPVLPDGAGLMKISGSTVVAHAVPIETRSRDVNEFNIDVQLGTVVAPTPANSNDAGLLCANTNQFAVDATSGMLSIKGGNLPAVLTLTGDDSTAISPDASGDIDILGVTVATGVINQALYADGDAVNNKIDLKIQLSTAAASASSSEVGVCSFDNGAFTVTDGFVELLGGGSGITAVNVDSSSGSGTDPVLPDGSGIIKITGSAVTAHSVPIETHSKNPNEFNIDIQVASDLPSAPSDKDAAGACSFDSTYFDVSTHGYVTAKYPDPPNRLKTCYLYEDFLSSFSSTGSGNVLFNCGGSRTTPYSESGHPGVWTMVRGPEYIISTGNANTGAYIHTIPLGSGTIEARTWVKFDALLSSEQCIFGFTEDRLYSSPTEYGWFRCVHGTANWLCETYDGTRTQNDSGVPVNTGWNFFEILVNAANASWEFYINKNLVATHTTNLPTADTTLNIHGYDPSYRGQKQYCDCVELLITPTGDRA